MKLSKPSDRNDPAKTLKAWSKELGDDADGRGTLQFELIEALLGLRSQANRDGWMNWDENFAEMVDLLLVFLPFGKTAESIRRDLLAVREAGEKGADEGRFGYDELDRLAASLVQWCEHFPEWIELPDGYHFWSDVPASAILQR
jgi:hypothetical protein